MSAFLSTCAVAPPFRTFQHMWSLYRLCVGRGHICSTQAQLVDGFTATPAATDMFGCLPASAPRVLPVTVTPPSPFSVPPSGLTFSPFLQPSHPPGGRPFQDKTSFQPSLPSRLLARALLTRFCSAAARGSFPHRGAPYFLTFVLTFLALSLLPPFSSPSHHIPMGFPGLNYSL